MFQHTNEFNSVYFQTAFENKHIIKRCFGLQIYKAETRRSIERRYVRRSIEQPPALQKNGGLLNYYRLRFRFPQPQLFSRTCPPFVFPLPPQYRHRWRADRSETMFYKNLIFVKFARQFAIWTLQITETSLLRGITAVRGGGGMAGV